MGSLTLPSSGIVYVDTDCVIYSVEKIEPFSTLLDQVWRSAKAGAIQVVSSELVVLETLVKPLKDGDTGLEALFRELLLNSEEVRLIPIDLDIVERAASIRAGTGMKTPDAIHAATGLQIGCAGFVTNDPGFRRVANLPVIVLADQASLPRP